jgi:hypothetical protein
VPHVLVECRICCRARLHAEPVHSPSRVIPSQDSHGSNTAFHLLRAHSRCQLSSHCLVYILFSYYSFQLLGTLIMDPFPIPVPSLDLFCTLMRIFPKPDIRHCPGMVPGTFLFNSYSISSRWLNTRPIFNTTHLVLPPRTCTKSQFCIAFAPAPALRSSLTSTSSIRPHSPISLVARLPVTVPSSIETLALLSPPPSLCYLPF